ncbi:p53-like transcription factor, partial [Westerdykella ornata]
MYSNVLFNQSDRLSVETPPFQEQENIHEIKTNDHSFVRPNIHAKIEKGFFLSGNLWTCYRRNYFWVQCSYELDPHTSHRPLYLQRPDRKGQLEQIQAFAVSLSAVVDGMPGKTVDLVQHTPKRDKGLQTTIPITKLWPTPPGSKHPHLTDTAYPLSAGGYGPQHPQPMSSPRLPLQGAPDSNQLPPTDTSTSSPSSSAGYSSSTSVHNQSNTTHTFERVQFKSATANNGKRRAQQQYYRVNVELYVDIRQKGANDPMWVMVARRSSCPLVVRGRSPSHYKSEGPNSAGRGGISSHVYG